MVGSFTQLLKNRYHGKLDDQADQYIDFAVEGVKRMQQLLHELLQYASLSSAEAQLQPTESLEACQNAIEQLRSAISDAGAIVEVDELPSVMAIQGQLTQVFQNLIANAIKFRADDRVPRIHIRAVDSGADWCFSVSDNGVGIESQYLTKIFIMFQRLHDRQTFVGSGIGLAICQKSVILHGGTIWAESEFGVGTTFSFTLRKTGFVNNVVSLKNQPVKLKYPVPKRKAA
jgi:light-regulated signal transduction histidine kinase (bacteriophytochrome)